MKTYSKLLCTLLALLTLFTFSSCDASNKADEGNGPLEDVEDGIYPSFGTTPDKEEAENAGSDVSQDFAENPFVATAENNVSTFSADVDTASYAYFRKLVNLDYSLSALKGQASSFRTEEFINYFDYDVSAPAENELFGTQVNIIDCPWNAGSVLMRLTLQAETAVEAVGNNLVFLIDVSGSMNSPHKLDLLKTSFTYLIDNLSPQDTVSIVTYSGKETVALDGCSGQDGERILNVIRSLTANGSTNGEAGLSKAYDIAEKHFIEGGNNRIIMASDGDLNVGISSEEELKRFIEQKRDAGIYLSVLGFGTGNYRDAKMETLADNGNGVYYYIDGESEAEKVFGTDIPGTLYTVAQDVKLQITFDTQYVAAYRLIGYENRVLNKEDFEDDTKDAGDVGAGHQVTVCYELTLAEGARNADAPWMKLDVRYKNPGETVSNLNEYEIGKNALTDTPNEDMKFLSCVLRTVMVLHSSRYLNETTLTDVLGDLRALDLSAYPDRMEFRSLIEKLVQDQV